MSSGAFSFVVVETPRRDDRSRCQPGLTLDDKLLRLRSSKTAILFSLHSNTGNGHRWAG